MAKARLLLMHTDRLPASDRHGQQAASVGRVWRGLEACVDGKANRWATSAALVVHSHSTVLRHLHTCELALRIDRLQVNRFVAIQGSRVFRSGQLGHVSPAGCQSSIHMTRLALHRLC